MHIVHAGQPFKAQHPPREHNMQSEVCTIVRHGTKSTIPVQGRWRYEDSEFKSSLGYKRDFVIERGGKEGKLAVKWLIKGLREGSCDVLTT